MKDARTPLLIVGIAVAMILGIVVAPGATILIFSIALAIALVAAVVMLDRRPR